MQDTNSNKLVVADDWRTLRINKDVLNKSKQHLNAEAVSKLRKEAQTLWDKDKQTYESLRQKASKGNEFIWLKTVVKKGTFSDKLSAHTKLLQDSCVHNLESLNTMIQMVTVKAKRGCIQAMDMLKDLFIGDILLQDSKLKTFADLVPYLDSVQKKRRDQQLILFLFEDNVARLYRQFIEAVEKVSHDSIDAPRDKAVNVIFELLSECPEQEHFLLEKLVNKLGDPTSKRASHVCYLLTKLVNDKHPAMAQTVVNEVERLMYRPNITMKAQYYGLCFLNEIILSDSDHNLADKLIKIYFDFFKLNLKKGEVNNKLMNAILTGVNRTFPYSKLDSVTFENHVDTFFKVVHFVNFNVAIQVLNLLLNVMDDKKNGLLSDRFYCVLYRFLVEIKLDTCSRKAVFLNLLYRSMKKDSDLKRVKAFIRRLQQVAFHSTSSISAAILLLISQLVKLKPELKNTNVSNQIAEESDDEEKFEDVRDESDGEQKKELVAESTPSWVHSQKDSNQLKYDIRHRNPSYANADKELLWETVNLCKHYHPTVALFADNVLNNNAIEYDGDPLTDFTIKNFLDRFVYRNPKKLNVEQKATKMDNKVFRRINEKVAPTIDTSNFTCIPEDKIAIEERFIYKYLSTKKREKEEDNESVTSEDFERMLEKYEPGFEKDLVDDLRQSKRKGGDEVDEDDELDLSDDEEYNKHFEDLDEELQEMFDEDEVDAKYEKRGHEKDISSLFASADKFAEMLEKNDDEFSDENEDSCSEADEKLKTKGVKRKKRLQRSKHGKRK